MNFTPVDNQDRVDGFCLVKTVEQKTSSKGDFYLDFTLGDADGEINAKLWRYSETEYGTFKSGDIVKVRGTVSQYNGTDQLRIERIRPAIEQDNVKVEDFVRSAAYSSEQMYNEIINIASSFKDDELKKLVLLVYADHRLQLLYWPAAYKLHHAVRGGLLLHTLSIVKLAQNVCKVYPFVDCELLLTGAMLHDISKIEEFIVNESGIAEGYSVDGNLLGHLVMGAAKIGEYAKKLRLSPRTATLVEHMIISHHGEPDFGAAVRPMFLEAELLSELDLMDSRVYEIKEALISTAEEDFSARLWSLDNRKLFNHSRTNLKQDPKLF